MFRMFANRRRAKDTILTIIERYGVEGMTVFVRDEMVYISAPDKPDMKAIMHFGSPLPVNPEDLLRWEKVTEYYREEGVWKFRV